MTSTSKNSKVMNDQSSKKPPGFASGLETLTIQRDSIQLLLTPGRSGRDLPTGKAPVPSLFLKGKERGKLGPVLWPLQPLPAFNCEEPLYPGMEIQLILLSSNQQLFRTEPYHRGVSWQLFLQQRCIPGAQQALIERKRAWKGANSFNPALLYLLGQRLIWAVSPLWAMQDETLTILPSGRRTSTA